MKSSKITSCYLGPAISPEAFIAEHFFLYLVKGKIEAYDGHRKYMMKAGEYGLIRKNHLIRYNKQKENGDFEKVVVIFDETFLKTFQEKHQPVFSKQKYTGAAVPLNKTRRMPAFVRSLMDCYRDDGMPDERLSHAKREELLIILLQTNPSLSGILFNFGAPQKINLEAFMNCNYRFNVSLGRFAYLTGRSLSAFKRDFKEMFSETPGRWLLEKRLQEAYFLISKKRKKPSDIYLDLGFEDLSHFSFAFKKKFGISPGTLMTAERRTLNAER